MRADLTNAIDLAQHEHRVDIEVLDHLATNDQIDRVVGEREQFAFQVYADDQVSSLRFADLPETSAYPNRLVSAT